MSGTKRPKAAEGAPAAKRANVQPAAEPVWRDVFSDEKDADPLAIKNELVSLRAAKQSFETALKGFRRRENMLLQRLATRDLELQQLSALSHEQQQSLLHAPTRLRNFLVDPAINMQFTRLKDEVKKSQDELKRVTDQLQAVKFDPNSLIGKQLINRMQTFQSENKDLGKKLSECRQKLSSELTMRAHYTDELLASYNEAHAYVVDLVKELDEANHTIQQLRLQLAAARTAEVPQQPMAVVPPDSAAAAADAATEPSTPPS
eukprot:gnl/Spiro4/12435_TR6568_c0_g1_i1.p2 gnl/Spiro4/12435_TR6568_c0_g1~~gnl/Spiro4/12435_TR6568_c0_g1_i1.p2  ORF type:complete len:261 (-),score=112.35 gnl/Spiro4/12435_TR6568_c0_g1_i1:40-822(-)